MKGESIRKKIRLSSHRLNDVAEKMGISPQALNNILNAEDVKTGSLERIAEAMNLPITYFYGDTTVSGVSGLTAYWARHSWATIAASLDIPEDTIALALGHSSAHTTTAIYIQRDLRKVDAANRKVIDFVLNKKPDAK